VYGSENVYQWLLGCQVEFLPARCYASTGTSHVRVSVCLSVTSRSSVETAECIELVFAWELLSTHPALRQKQILVSPKIRVLPSGTLSQTPYLENFALVYRTSKRVIDLARES